MTDQPGNPGDDYWAPDDDTGEGADSWSWLDDAVDAWDHLEVADEGPEAGGPAGTADLGEVSDPGFEASEEATGVPEDGGGAAGTTGGQPGSIADAPDGDSGPVDLSLPGDPGGADDDGGASVEDSGAGGDVEMSTGDAGVLADVLADQPMGTCSVAALGEALGLVGVEDAEGVLAAFDGEQVDAREAVGAFDFAGVGARVEYAGIGELLERLAAGEEVLLGGGEPHALVSIDTAAGEVTVEPLAGGPRTSLAIELFEEAWEETANELMVLEADNPGIRLGGGEVCVVPVAVADIS